MLTDPEVGEFPRLEIENDDVSTPRCNLRGAEVGAPSPNTPPKKPEEKEAKLPKKAVEEMAIELMVDKDVLVEATDFSNGLCIMIGKASSTITKLPATGLGNDVSARIKSHCTSCETHYRNIKKLAQAEDCLCSCILFKPTPQGRPKKASQRQSRRHECWTHKAQRHL